MNTRRDLIGRVGWACVTEPNDHVAGALIRALGAAEAWEALEGYCARSFQFGNGLIIEVLLESGFNEATARKACERWSRRVSQTNPIEMIRKSQLLGAEILTPDSSDWPRQLDDLGLGAPHCLWVRGAVDTVAHAKYGAAIVGSRANTHYGEHVAAMLVQELCAEGRVVTSGGAFGIDAIAHRTAISTNGKTLAVSAGGVDRYYPAGNANLLRSIIESGGALCSELPIGALPMKSRFLSRNRVIAALSGATIIVEAAWRSGALSTAHHALELGRQVGAVPGSITSAQSAGSHRLLKSGLVTLVSSGSDAIELILGSTFDGAQAPLGYTTGEEGLAPGELRVIDGMSSRRALHEEEISLNSGLVPSETLQILGSLEMRGLVKRETSGWRTSK